MYTAFASIYDRLMADVDYQAWARHYSGLLKRYGIREGKVAECACGTGGLTIPLSQMGYQMTGIDLSADMLFEAAQKARKAGAAIPFVKQDMRYMHLHRQMDAVLATNDGINYLRNQQELMSFFSAAYTALRPGGVLAFDVSTPYKLETLLGNSFIGDETQEVAYLWKNTYSAAHQSVHMMLSIFVREEGDTYRRIEEEQQQYAYNEPLLRDTLEQVGFTQIIIFGGYRMTPPVANDERWHVIARRPESAEGEL